jgi:hypothetical protein
MSQLRRRGLDHELRKIGAIDQADSAYTDRELSGGRSVMDGDAAILAAGEHSAGLLKQAE